MERADALKSLSEKFSLTHAELARRVGLDRSSVTNLIRLTELEDSLRTLLQEGRLSLGHGKALLMMKPGAAREKLGERAEREGWSVRKLEQAAAGIKQRGDEVSLMLASTGHAGQGGGVGAALGGVSSSGAMSDSETMILRARDAALRDLERQLGEHLGTRVRVRTDKSRKRGSLVVSFYDLDQFDGLMSKMGFALK
jgi:ParB family chromosome partitioning protein